MVIIALNGTIRDGASYVNCLTPIPEEWLVERDWFIVNHWEDKFCRDAYKTSAFMQNFNIYVHSHCCLQAPHHKFVQLTHW